MHKGNQMQNFSMPADLRNAIVQYLAARPFAEVHQLIPALMGLQEDVRQVPAEEPKSEGDDAARDV